MQSSIDIFANEIDDLAKSQNRNEQVILLLSHLCFIIELDLHFLNLAAICINTILHIILVPDLLYTFHMLLLNKGNLSY